LKPVAYVIFILKAAGGRRIMSFSDNLETKKINGLAVTNNKSTNIFSPGYKWSRVGCGLRAAIWKLRRKG
jgi:hypothetical protein